MIFSYIPGQGNNFSDSFGFGGRSWSDIKKYGKDAWGGIDVDAISRYNEAIVDPDLSLSEAWEYARTDLNGDIIKLNRSTEALIKSSNGAKVSQEALGVAVKQYGTSAQAASLSTKILHTALNTLGTLAISALFNLAIQGIDYIIHTQQRLDDAAQTAKDNLEKEEGTLADLNSQLENTKSLMKDLEGRELTFVEEDEYNRLKKTNDELEREIKLQEARVRVAEKESRKTAVRTVEHKRGSISENNSILVDFALGTEGFDASKYGEYDNKFLSENPYAVFTYENYAKLNADMLAALKQSSLDAQKKYYDYLDGRAKEELEGAEKQQAEIYEQAWKDAEALYDGSYKVVDDYALYLREQIGDLSRVKNPTTETDKAFNAMFDEAEKFENTLLHVEDQSAQFVSDTVLGKYADSAQKIKEIIEESGEISADQVASEFGDIVAAFKEYGWGLEDIVRHLNEIYAVAEKKPQLPDFSTTLSSLYKNTEQYTTLTDAIEEQASAGKISVETMKALTDISPDFINYLEKTADGYAINTDALMEYIEAQDLMEKTKAINAIHDLNEELKDADITSDRRDQILAEIQKWEMLVYEIENATGALAEYRAAQATQNQDSEFKEIADNYEAMKEAYELGKTGTDDFQSFVGFMLGEDWEEQIGKGADKIYASKEAAYKIALEKAARYYGQEVEADNYINFINDLVKNGFGTRNKDGSVTFENIDVAEVARVMQTSEDSVRAQFGLMESYDIPVTYNVDVDASEVEYAEAVIEELEKRRKTAQTELSKSKIGTEAHARWSAQVNELDKMIDIAGRHAADMESDAALTIDGAIAKVAELEEYQKFLTERGFEIPLSVTGDIGALNSFLNNFEIAKDKDGNTIGYKVEVKDAEEATKLIENLEGQIETVKADPNISLLMKATFESEALSMIDRIKSYYESNDGEATFVIGVDDKSAELIDRIKENDPEAVVIQIGFDKDQLQAVHDEREKLGEDIHTKVFYDVQDGDNSEDSSAAGKPPLSEDGRRIAQARTSFEGSISGTGLMGQETDDGTYRIVSPDSYFAELASNITEATGKIPTVEELQSAFKSALKSSEVVVDPKEDKESYAEKYSKPFSNLGIANQQQNVLPVNAELNVKTEKAEDTIEEMKDEIESTEIEVGVNTNQDNGSADIDFLIESSDYILSMADAYDAAQSSQNAMKQSTDELKAALANLAVADQGDALSWQAASEQLNSAVTNYQTAYNTLASELEELAPAEVEANISSAKKTIDSLNGRTITVNVKANNTSPSSSSSSGLLGTIKGWFSGSSNASGTQNARKGMSLVDEEGPELIEHVSEGTYELGTDQGPRFTKLNKGDIVHTADETKKILSRMGGAIGGFFRDGLNNTKAFIGRAFAKGTDPWGMAIAEDIKKEVSNKVADKINSDLGKNSHTTLVDIEVPSKKMESSNNKKSSSSGSSGGSKNGKLDDYLSKLFDWIEVRLTRLQQSTDGWLAQVAEAVGYVVKNAKLDNALTSVAKQIDASTKAYSRYKQQAQEIADKFNLDPELIRLVQEGEIDIASYDEDTQKKINAYKEYFDKAVDCKMAVSDLVAQEKELATTKLDNISDHFQWRIDRYDATISKRATDIDLKRATGKRVTKDDYTDAMMATASKIVELQKSRDTLQAEFNSMVEKGYIAEGTEEWYEYTSRLEEADEAIVQTRIDLSELQDEVHNVDLTNLQYALADIERAADKIHQSMSLHEAQGREHTADDYLGLIKNGFSYINNLRDQNRELEMQQQLLDPLSEKYQELQEQIDSNNQSISDMMVSQEQWNDSVVDLKIGELQKYRDELSKTNADYQSQLQIQQSLEELERAKSQRTVRVFREGQGFVYQRDEDAVRDAQNNFDQLLNEQLLAKIDDVIEAIGKSKADTNVYDANGVLLGEQYTLPSLDDLSSFLVGTSGENIVNKSMDDVKKAVWAQVLGGATTTQNMPSFQIGDIVVQGVDNANALAEAIIDEFPNALLQALNSKV